MNKKKIIIIVSAVVALVAVALVLFLVVFKKDAYRLLKVFEVDGTASVTRGDIGMI